MSLILKTIRPEIILPLLLLTLFLQTTTHAAQKPNIVYILADDKN
ncbi:MAG: hypothetical protein ABIK07_13435 [Planctomycetota bacterium]